MTWTGADPGQLELYGFNATTGLYSGFTTTTALDYPAASLTPPSNYWQPRASHNVKGPSPLRHRGLVIFPCVEGIDGDTLHFQIVGWVKCMNPVNKLDVVEYFPIIIWRGLATISGTGTYTSGIASGYGTDVHFADTLAVVGASTGTGWGGSVPTLLSSQAGFNVTVYDAQGEITADEGRAAISIDDATQIFDGFTLMFDNDAGAGSTPTSSNALIGSIN